jgi:hypothetical protein
MRHIKTLRPSLLKNTGLTQAQFNMLCIGDYILCIDNKDLEYHLELGYRYEIVNKVTGTVVVLSHLLNNTSLFINEQAKSRFSLVT